ncbi:cyclophilin-like fold protein [Shewanella algae]|uniref:cyclophilin-like fold protein n=1 Tax=Shewanella algae TaxID=38313 RepID=UPI00313B97B8
MHSITLLLDDKTLVASLEDNSASRDFLALLPLELSDYGASEKIADLPKKLSTLDVPSGHSAKVGDLTYYAPWGNLAIFYRDHGYAQGLIPLGRIDTGKELMKFSGKQEIRIEKSGLIESKQLKSHFNKE